MCWHSLALARASRSRARQVIINSMINCLPRGRYGCMPTTVFGMVSSSPALDELGPRITRVKPDQNQSGIANLISLQLDRFLFSFVIATPILTLEILPS